MAEQVLIEVCVDSVASATAAERGGAARVELCTSLIEGGVTPSAGMIAAVRRRISIGLQVIIRPRGGDFCYEEDEFDLMGRDIEIAKELGADGVVLGVLSIDGTVDVDRTRQLVDIARPLNVTFHRAIDMSADLLEALDDICDTGADRVLTSGGEQECLKGAETLSRLVKSAGNRITIMAGGGIGPDDVAGILERTGVTEIHVGMSSNQSSPMLYRNPRVSLGKAKGLEYQRAVVLEENVRKLQRSIALART
ncbi:MAG TPA: copper homeostasis protein CutC [Candidatus Sulfotelmatobacter sp.]|nr:copper homeostasis protein CutC [Candidatus Sulfotelmatobacter sp.]